MYGSGEVKVLEAGVVFGSATGEEDDIASRGSGVEGLSPVPGEDVPT